MNRSRAMLGCPKPVGRIRRDCDKCFEAGKCLEKYAKDTCEACLSYGACFGGSNCRKPI